MSKYLTKAEELDLIREEVVRLYDEQEWTMKKIARHMTTPDRYFCLQDIQKALARWRVPARFRIKPDGSEAAIARDLKRGMTVDELAACYGVHRTTIYRALKRAEESKKNVKP